MPEAKAATAVNIEQVRPARRLRINTHIPDSTPFEGAPPPPLDTTAAAAATPEYRSGNLPSEHSPNASSFEMGVGLAEEERELARDA